jgi:hypothetical protein
MNPERGLERSTIIQLTEKLRTGAAFFTTFLATGFAFATTFLGAGFAFATTFLVTAFFAGAFFAGAFLPTAKVIVGGVKADVVLARRAMARNDFIMAVVKNCSKGQEVEQSEVYPCVSTAPLDLTKIVQVEVPGSRPQNPDLRC